MKSTDIASRLVIDSTLVRGLSYYTGPIFEIMIPQGKEVGSISGGGRYDKLVELFGGEPTPAVGISFGIERIVDLIQSNEKQKKKIGIDGPVIQIVYDPNHYDNVLKIAQELRKKGIRAEYDLLQRNFSKQLKLANQNSVKYSLILGQDEIQSGKLSVKDMDTGAQKQMTLEEILVRLNKNEPL